MKGPPEMSKIVMKAVAGKSISVQDVVSGAHESLRFIFESNENASLDLVLFIGSTQGRRCIRLLEGIPDGMSITDDMLVSLFGNAVRITKNRMPDGSRMVSDKAANSDDSDLRDILRQVDSEIVGLLTNPEKAKLLMESVIEHRVELAKALLLMAKAANKFPGAFVESFIETINSDGSDDEEAEGEKTADNGELPDIIKKMVAAGASVVSAGKNGGVLSIDADNLTEIMAAIGLDMSQFEETTKPAAPEKKISMTFNSDDFNSSANVQFSQTGNEISIKFAASHRGKVREYEDNTLQFPAPNGINIHQLSERELIGLIALNVRAIRNTVEKRGVTEAEAKIMPALADFAAITMNSADFRRVASGE